ncbi:MAG: Ku protein [Actinomycetota bacterium]
MPRATWSGAISFGLVTVPVRLYTAVSRKSVRFNQLDKRTGSRIKRKWVSALDGEEVDNDDLVRGYEITSGNYVTVSDDELRSLDPEASRTIDIVEFVDLAEIEPLMYDSAYFLEPDELAAKAYRVLVEALDRAQKVAIARIVMRNKEYLAAVRPSNGVLVLSTMVYADEVNSVEEIDGITKASEIEISDAEILMAEQLISTLEAEFEPEKYRDGYRDRVLDLIQRKSDGEEIVVADEAAPAANSDVVDLMAALEASVAAAKEARGRHPSAGKEKSAAKKSTAKKTTAKKSAAKKKASKDEEPAAKSA